MYTYNNFLHIHSIGMSILIVPRALNECVVITLNFSMNFEKQGLRQTNFIHLKIEKVICVIHKL